MAVLPFLQVTARISLDLAPGAPEIQFFSPGRFSSVPVRLAAMTAPDSSGVLLRVGKHEVVHHRAGLLVEALEVTDEGVAVALKYVSTYGFLAILHEGREIQTPPSKNAAHHL